MLCCLPPPRCPARSHPSQRLPRIILLAFDQMLSRIQVSLVLVSAASVAALNIGSPVQPRTAVGRVVPSRRGGKQIPEPEPTGFDLQEFATDACITTLRLTTCALMVHHGLDKIQVRF